MNVFNYDNFYKEYIDKRLMLKTPSIIFDKFKSYLNDYSSVLDIGCGTGLDSFELSRINLNIVGIDNSIKMLRYAKNIQNNLNLILMDFNNMTFSKKFDGIWCRNVLQHYCLSDFEKNILNMSNFLEKKGILYFSVPIKGDIEKKNESITFVKIFQYNYDEIENILKKKFEIKDIFIEHLKLDWYNFFCKLI
ncbi:MAG: class I SAM-dependent methyltransferase [Candidatus Nanoarchaeia archaeon]|jgi:SAM-dependent methyltransferase